MGHFLWDTRCFTLDRENMWRILMIQEIINLKRGDLEVEGFDFDELNDLLDHS